jgi:hypothetical protein
MARLRNMKRCQIYSAILIFFLSFLLACQPGTPSVSDLTGSNGSNESNGSSGSSGSNETNETNGTSGTSGTNDFSVVNVITGRLGMAPREPFGCWNLTYSSDEQVNGKWVAGADGTTFGGDRDGILGTNCGKVFTIRNKKTGKGAEFILVDRIWENDGVNGRRYSNKSDADAKINDIGPGNTQLDIAIQPYYDLFGGSDPAVTDFEVIGLDTGL